MAVIFTRKGEQILVDDADYATLARHKWHVNVHGYAARNITLPDGQRTVSLMHREILGLAHGSPTVVDHANHNSIDNRRNNIRACTRQQNQMNRGKASHNTSGFKGVTKHKQCGKWAAQMNLKGKHIHLGLFDTAEEAHAAYCKAADEHHGEFANYGKRCDLTCD